MSNTLACVCECQRISNQEGNDNAQEIITEHVCVWFHNDEFDNLFEARSSRFVMLSCRLSLSRLPHICAAYMSEGKISRIHYAVSWLCVQQFGNKKQHRMEFDLVRVSQSLKLFKNFQLMKTHTWRSGKVYVFFSSEHIWRCWKADDRAGLNTNVNWKSFWNVRCASAGCVRKRLLFDGNSCYSTFIPLSPSRFFFSFSPKRLSFKKKKDSERIHSPQLRGDSNLVDASDDIRFCTPTWNFIVAQASRAFKKREN